jgi:hypothetical protein
MRAMRMACARTPHARAPPSPATTHSSTRTCSGLMPSRILASLAFSSASTCAASLGSGSITTVHLGRAVVVVAAVAGVETHNKVSSAGVASCHGTKERPRRDGKQQTRLRPPPPQNTHTYTHTYTHTPVLVVQQVLVDERAKHVLARRQARLERIQRSLPLAVVRFAHEQAHACKPEDGSAGACLEARVALHSSVPCTCTHTHTHTRARSTSGPTITPGWVCRGRGRRSRRPWSAA